MDYRTFGIKLIDEIEEIYSENGWISYLGDRDKLKKAFDNSLYILGAFDADKLVGFVRILGDGIHLIYIQDLILRPAYQRQGIGSVLYKMVIDHFKEVRTILLITDSSDEDANAFYKAMGMSDKLAGFKINTYFAK